jgi:uncharacterized protein (UPF0548 family)
VTYAAVGATLRGPMPDGYHHETQHTVLPGGPDAFARAADGLRTWQAHRGIGATVIPDGPPVEAATVLVSLPLGPLRVLAPCRIVAVVDEPARYGFAYGTLPGHPEEGEEAFLVRRGPDGPTFEIRAFSRPADLLARLGGPVTRLVQRRATRGYLDGLARWVGGATSP